MCPIDALRSRCQQLPREDVTIYVRGAVVHCEEKSKRYTENITLLRTLAGPGDTGVDGRLRPSVKAKPLGSCC
eukprot:scaffold129662_cov72-Phaeocystis_antarctica.AAC.1